MRLLVLDFDTMLADGRVFVDPRGREVRALHVRDLQGIAFLVRGGVRVAVLVRRGSLAAARPVRPCGASLIVPGGRGKLACARSRWRRARIDPTEVAYASSDLLDQVLLESVGFAITSPEGGAALAAHVHWVTKSGAGAGAVREIAERVLRVQGKWANVLGEAMMV